ncbi:MAG: DUF4838 domain-containing protein [Clostridiales bacterium]|jgi:hypothetical protein|nr:DUF4838 domain-containing protein [Clostridiales bacterium]
MSDILLADHGSCLGPVWVDALAADTEFYAAEEASRFLSQITGASFPVLRGGQMPTTCVVVGDSDILRADVDLGQEGFALRTVGKRAVIVGGRPRGVLYGVYSFLERLGCRWFSSKVSHIPRRDKLVIPALDLRETPALEYREIYYEDSRDANWSARNKLNGNSMELDSARGGKISYFPFVHTFNSLLSPEDYFDEHPEYFSLVNGERLRENTQLCLTNPDVLRLCVAKVEQWIKERPDANIISVSQNDCYNPCQCENCKRIDDEQGTHAGSLIWFLNQLADQIGEKYPHVVIDTLAYQYTRPAPKTLRPRPNICVRLCSIECCFAHPLRDCDHISSFGNRIRGDSFQKDLADWAKICDRLYIWDYVVNFSHYVMPFPNFHVLGDNIRYFIENHVKGIFEEGATTVYGGAELAELRAYVLAKLLWNPKSDTNELVEEFITGYYQAASAPILAYFNLIHSKLRENPKIHFGIYDPPRIPYLTDEVVEECDRLFDRALALADDEEVLRRVRIARMPIQYWKVYKMPLTDPSRPRRSDDFFAELTELGIHEIWEGRTMAQSQEQMKKGVVWRFPES